MFLLGLVRIGLLTPEPCVPGMSVCWGHILFVRVSQPVFSLASKCIPSVGSKFFLTQGGFSWKMRIKPLLARRETFSMGWALNTDPPVS